MLHELCSVLSRHAAEHAEVQALILREPHLNRAALGFTVLLHASVLQIQETLIALCCIASMTRIAQAQASCTRVLRVKLGAFYALVDNWSGFRVVIQVERWSLILAKLRIALLFARYLRLLRCSTLEVGFLF